MRKVGLGALTNKRNVESISKKLSDQRLEDISKSVELLEDGIRTFIETNKEEIRNNEFLREKIKTLAATCNVDLEAATSAAGRLKPGVLSSLLGDALFGGASNSSSMKKFYDFLSSRVVTLCMRERVLRGPVIPLSVVLNELRKRYPLEEITLHDVIQAIEHVKPLNPNIFVLEQEQQQQQNSTSSPHVAGGDPSNFFIAFQPLSTTSKTISATTTSSKKLNSNASGTDAIRIVVLANELANLRRRELFDTLKKKGLTTTTPTTITSPAGVSSSTSVSPSVLLPRGSFSATAAARHQQQNPISLNSALGLQLQQTLGLVCADEQELLQASTSTSMMSLAKSFYIRIKVSDVVERLSGKKTSSAATNTSTAASSSSSKNKVWSKSRAKLALKAARELCEGWYDREDNSTWLYVIVA